LANETGIKAKTAAKKNGFKKSKTNYVKIQLMATMTFSVWIALGTRKTKIRES